MDDGKKPKQKLGKRIKRKIQDIGSDIKGGRRASKGSRKIKRSLKDSSSKKTSFKPDRRAERKVKLEKKSTERVFKKIAVPKEEKAQLKEKGVKAKKYSAVKYSGKAKRAKRTLGTMAKTDKRRTKRKLK
jgi:hypothetical protein